MGGVLKLSIFSSFLLIRPMYYIGALIITYYTIFRVPYCNYDIMGPKTVV